MCVVGGWEGGLVGGQAIAIKNAIILYSDCNHMPTTNQRGRPGEIFVERARAREGCAGREGGVSCSLEGEAWCRAGG